MNLARHSKVERLSALAILIAPLALMGILLATTAYQNYESNQRAIESLISRHVALSERRRDLAALRTLRDRFADADPGQFGILVAETVELARVQIQRQLQRVAERGGATISEFRPVDIAEPGVVSAAISVVLPMETLPDFLAGIANVQPPIFIDGLNIRSGTMIRADAMQQLLLLDITLAAYTSRNSGSVSK